MRTVDERGPGGLRAFTFRVQPRLPEAAMTQPDDDTPMGAGFPEDDDSNDFEEPVEPIREPEE